ncbi:hypothetical protein BGZ72_004974 [Mortierella alpina]|nr:hypothetical protein BGZ72_004974 [Mortierella alpina]
MTLRRRMVPSAPSLPATAAAAATPSRSRLYKTPSILELPFEILVGQILAILDLAELGCLSRVCRYLHQLCETDYLWQKKFFRDFTFRPHRTLRQLGGWKRLYQAMDRVEVYTWGSNGDCRLGYGRTPKKVYESVPKRVRRLDGMGMVQLAPTGWGCHALDRHGNVWAWGRIMESNGIRSDAKPRMLKWPRNVTQLVAGRQVVLAKDADGQVWQWCRENKAVEVTFSLSEAIQPSSGTINTTTTTTNHDRTTEDPVIQLAAGWEICAALTRSGRIFAWRPPQSADARYQYRIHVEHSVCLKGQGMRGYEAAVLDRDAFVQMAAGSDYVVAVTSLERVYIFRTLDSPHDRQVRTGSSFPLAFLQDQEEQQQQQRENRIMVETIGEGSLQERVVEMRGRILGAGLPLPIFSEALTHTITESYEENDQRERRRRHCRQQSSTSSFTGQWKNDTTGRTSGSSSSHPTTVSANFERFAIHHSSGKVLLGRHDVQADSRPIIMERLVSNACQVEFGDHHQGLLTEDGQLRTWGSFCDGALGHGDLRSACAVPTVVEGPLKNKFVIRIGMAGWHSACLAIDMSEERASGAHGLESHTPLWAGQASSAIAIAKAKDDMVDDGYHSLEHSGTSGNSNGSSSDSFDSSDGEERMLHRDAVLTGAFEADLGRASGSKTELTPSSSWGSRPMAQESSSSLSTSCSASCSLLVSPHSHRPASGVIHARPTPLRKRSLSMVVKEGGHGHRGPPPHLHHHHHHQQHHLGEPSKDSRARMMAMTRLNPTLTEYEPELTASRSLHRLSDYRQHDQRRDPNQSNSVDPRNRSGGTQTLESLLAKTHQESHIAGPYCTQLLGDLGAEVIKVENPKGGDDTRAWGPPFAQNIDPSDPAQESAYFLGVNRNKKSITVNIRSEEGRKLVQDLAKKVDILVENYVPGKLDEMGLGYKELSALNPGLIYTSITGYGQTGPYRTRPGYDVMIEAEAGLMYITGEQNGTPVKVGVAVTDLTTGLYAHGAIMAAIIARYRTGRGQHVDCSLLDSQVVTLANIASSYLIAGQEAQRMGTSHPSIVPYQVLPSQDSHIMIGAGNDGQFRILCSVLGLESLCENPLFRTNKDRVQHRKELIEILTARLQTKKNEEWLKALEGRGIPFAPINNIQQTFEHPQVVARGMIQEVEHPKAGKIKVTGPAVKYSDTKPSIRLPPPLLGQHTEEILREVLEYDEERIRELKEKKAV